MLPHEMRALTSSSHCARTDANDRPVLPVAGADAASSTTTRWPRPASASATAAPMMPAPITITSQAAMVSRMAEPFSNFKPAMLLDVGGPRCRGATHLYDRRDDVVQHR